jgi:ferredoxin, 2Fe-2S
LGKKRMTSLIITRKDGEELAVEATDGLSVMEVLRPLDIGVAGDCEGSAACASCHVWVDREWSDRLAEPSEDEAEMLDCAFRTRPTSRLSCQILVSPSINGLRLSMPRD